MSKCDVLLTRPIHEAGLKLLKEKCTVNICQGSELSPPAKEVILKDIQSARVLICLLTDKIDEQILNANPNLKGVANYAVGFNNIDMDAANQLGIPVANTPGVLTETTADLTWALIMSVSRKIPQAHQYMLSGQFQSWSSDLFLGHDIGPGPSQKPKTLGVIGFGRIGKAVCRRAKGFGMNLLVFDPTGGDEIKEFEGATIARFEEVIEQSDILTLHCNLTDQTHHLLGKQEFQRMKPTAYVINTARGQMIDEQALVEALETHEIAGAGLDVFENEPNMAPGLSELPNVVLLPHIGSATQETRAEMARLTAQSALAFLAGEKSKNTVNSNIYQSNAYRKRQSG